MTERLFDKDAYCRSFTAVVQACRKEKNGYALQLDRTAFYPEGGGQPGDTGVLTERSGQTPAVIRVTDTKEEQEVIWHLTDSPASEGTVLGGEIDWEPRFDRMQNHTGEHIVSGLIHEAYGYDNVGFHMGADCITIDLSGELSMQQLEEIEYKANEIVWKDVQPVIDRCTEEEAAGREYRSKKELHGIVRIVTIPGADVCACCGTHVQRTGEIGLIRIISSEKFRGGSRVEMLCGRRAFLYDTSVVRQNKTVSVALSANPLETGDAVLRTKEALVAETFRAVGLQQKLFALTASKLEGAGNVLIFGGPMAPDHVRRLADAVLETCGGICAVFAGDETEGYKYAVGERNGDLREFVKGMNAALEGRGGGKPFFAQGSVKADAAAIEKYFAGQADRSWKIEQF